MAGALLAEPPDETESQSILWKDACCQTTVLNSSICPHPIFSPLPGLRNPLPLSLSPLPGDRGEIQGLFVPTSSPALKVLSCRGLCFAEPRQCCSIGEGEIMQGCRQEWLKSCYLCTVRTGDLRQMGPFPLSGPVWRVCMFPWGPVQVPCLLSSEIGSFHHRKCDCVHKDLEICC